MSSESVMQTRRLAIGEGWMLIAAQPSQPLVQPDGSYSRVANNGRFPFRCQRAGRVRLRLSWGLRARDPLRHRSYGVGKCSPAHHCRPTVSWSAAPEFDLCHRQFVGGGFAVVRFSWVDTDHLEGHR